MICTVNGYNTIRSKKNDKDYTIVHVTTDIPFPSSTGAGYQNLEFFLAGNLAFTVGGVYTAVTEQYLDSGVLKTRVVGLTD